MLPMKLIRTVICTALAAAWASLGAGTRRAGRRRRFGGTRSRQSTRHDPGEHEQRVHRPGDRYLLRARGPGVRRSRRQGVRGELARPGVSPTCSRCWGTTTGSSRRRGPPFFLITTTTTWWCAPPRWCPVARAHPRLLRPRPGSGPAAGEFLPERPALIGSTDEDTSCVISWLSFSCR